MATSEPESSENKLALQVQALLWEKGHNALSIAKQSVLTDKVLSNQIQTALEYFMSTWNDVVHPALMALSCEAVGGKAELTTKVGAAYVLLAGGADVHDDIIDDSYFKYSQKTVLGKFGKDIAVLAGDALLFKGFFGLQNACENASKEQKTMILDSTRQAFYGISAAEAQESQLKQTVPSSVEYVNMIKTKAAVGRATMKIGSFIGNGASNQVELLGTYGEVLGTLFTIRDEFIDIYDLAELKSRVANECLPLPILYALEDLETGVRIKELLKKNSLTKADHGRLLKLLADSKETGALKMYMNNLIEEQIVSLKTMPFCKSKLMLLLKSTVEDL